MLKGFVRTDSIAGQELVVDILCNQRPLLLVPLLGLSMLPLAGVEMILG